MRSLVLTVISLLSSALICVATDDGFLIPPGFGVEGNFRDNPQYRIGEIINVTWVTDDLAVDLLLGIRLPNEPGVPGKSLEYITIQRLFPERFYRWIVDLDSFPQAKDVLDKKGLAVLFFLISEPGHGTDSKFRSHYFNVTKSALPTTASTTPPATATATIPTPTSTSPPSPSEPATATSPSAAVIGGAVGGAVGGLLLLGALGYFVWRHNHNKKRVLPGPMMQYSHSPVTRHKAWLTSELDGRPVIHEAP
ncbi:hypothetical protein GTR04_5170 [Trichophyton interdigitale]|nr:hypothetical protein GTR04_5170 [Trichophyton interdigitale]